MSATLTTAKAKLKEEDEQVAELVTGLRRALGKLRRRAHQWVMVGLSAPMVIIWRITGHPLDSCSRNNAMPPWSGPARSIRSA
jgi:hypothetical protein